MTSMWPSWPAIGPRRNAVVVRRSWINQGLFYLRSRGLVWYTLNNMKPLIVANWKMNPVTLKEAKALFDAVKKGVKGASAEVVVCPPSIYLGLFDGVALGAQNIFYKDKGAFTGEISAPMARDMGIEYVIVGHSERRAYFVETNEDVNKKIKAALAENLVPIVCIGEGSEERELKAEVLEKQMLEGLKGVSTAEMKKIVIAYEPVWAIGTGNNCSVDETLSSLLFIRKIISNMYSREVADTMQILYGGSVKQENAASYIKEGGANGLLVGGASLKAEEFVEIVKSTG